MRESLPIWLFLISLIIGSVWNWLTGLGFPNPSFERPQRSPRIIVAGYPYGTSALVSRTRTRLSPRTFVRYSLFFYLRSVSNISRSSIVEYPSNNWCRVQFDLEPDLRETRRRSACFDFSHFAAASLFGVVALGLAFIATVVLAILIVVLAVRCRRCCSSCSLQPSQSPRFSVSCGSSQDSYCCSILFAGIRSLCARSESIPIDGIDPRRQHSRPRPFESRGVVVEHRRARRHNRRRPRANPRRACPQPRRVPRGGPHAGDSTAPDPASRAPRVRSRHRAHRTPEPHARRCRCRRPLGRSSTTASDSRSPIRMRVPQKLERSRSVCRRVEQAQSSASTAAVPQVGGNSERREHAARPRETRRDSDSSESSHPERTSRASPRKRALQSHADPDPANATHARTQSPAHADNRSADVDPDAVELHRARPPPPADTERRFPFECVLVSVPPAPAHRRVDPRRSATPRTCDRTRGSPLSTRTLARPQNNSIGTLRTARHCLKPHRAPDSSSPPASKFGRSSRTPSCSSRCVTAREVAGRTSSFRGSAAKKPRKFVARTSPIRSPITRNSAKASSRFSAASSSKAPSARNSDR